MNWTKPRMLELFELERPRKPAAVEAILLYALPVLWGKERGM